MLTMTNNAATEIRNLVAQPEVPDDGGVRIASNGDGALTLALAAAPAEGDAVVEEGGARVFLEHEAGQLLDDKQLDCGVDAQGQVQFTLNQQAEQLLTPRPPRSRTRVRRSPSGRSRAPAAIVSSVRSALPREPAPSRPRPRGPSAARWWSARRAAVPGRVGDLLDRGVERVAGSPLTVCSFR